MVCMWLTVIFHSKCTGQKWYLYNESCVHLLDMSPYLSILNTFLDSECVAPPRVSLTFDPVCDDWEENIKTLPGRRSFQVGEIKLCSSFLLMTGFSWLFLALTSSMHCQDLRVSAWKSEAMVLCQETTVWSSDQSHLHLHCKDPVEAKHLKDASKAHPFGGFPSTPNLEKTLGYTQNLLEGLHILIWRSFASEEHLGYLA